MDNASDNWFTLDVAGDATVAADASAKDKSSEDLERLVFGDNFSSRLKAQKSIVPAAKEKPQSKDRAKKSVSRQQKKTGRPAAAAASDDGDSSSAGDVAASSDGDARSSDLVKATSDSGRLRAAAWQDEDDDAIQVDLSSKPRTKKLRSNESETVISGTEYSQRLRKQLAKLHGAQSWAQPKAADSASDSDSGEDGVKALLAKGGAIIDKGRPHALRRGTIDVLRCPDANAADPNSAVVQSVRFHPQSSVMLTAGLDKTLRLFNVDGAESSKIQGVHFSDLPIFCAEWSAHGNEIYCAGRRPYFYCYDVGKGCVSKLEIGLLPSSLVSRGTARHAVQSLVASPKFSYMRPCLQVHRIVGRDDKAIHSISVSPAGNALALPGNHGVVTLLNPATRSSIGSITCNGSVRACSFTSDGSKLLCSGNEGLVYIWDVGTRRCMGKFADDGSTDTIALSQSPDSKFIAASSASGVVNIYDAAEAMNSPSTVKPLKSVMNITTRVETLCWHPSSELLSVSSHSKKEAFRLVHAPSFSVFSNWPTSSTPLHSVSSVAFSGNGKFVAVGNDRGRVLLYKLRHFSM